MDLAHLTTLLCGFFLLLIFGDFRKKSQELLTSLWLLLRVSIPFTPVAVSFYQSLLNFVWWLWQALQLVALSPMRLSWCLQLPCGCCQQLPPCVTCIRASLLPADTYLQTHLFGAWSWDVGLFSEKLKSGVLLQGSNFWQRGRQAAGSTYARLM